jgi:thiazole/oxazole-forming peptide maturase SagD family component
MLTPTAYPYTSHLLEDVLKTVCAEQSGIVQGLLASPVRYSKALAIRSVVANMPAYHKILLNPDLDMQYHLSGYGMFYEEALIRLAAEAIERYALLVAPHTLGNRLRYGSYRELAVNGDVIPFELLTLYSDADYERLNAGDYRGLRRVGQDDVVGWVRCATLADPERELWVPAQMLFVGYPINREHGEIPFCPGFSTGTAAHASFEKALQNALLEFVEIDALMVTWYTGLKARLVAMNNLTLAALCPDLFSEKPKFDIHLLDLRVLDSVEACALGAVLVNREDARPLIAFGAQGSLDPVHACYRALMEAVAISFLGLYGPLYLPRQYFVAESRPDFTDLDRNVAFFAAPEDAAGKRRIIREMMGETAALTGMRNFETGDARADTARLVKDLSGVSEHGVFLDITPPETRSRGWYVARVFLPELVTMCVPGVPYSEHPRIKSFGGIKNHYPHPLP